MKPGTTEGDAAPDVGGREEDPHGTYDVRPDGASTCGVENEPKVAPPGADEVAPAAPTNDDEPGLLQVRDVDRDGPDGALDALRDLADSQGAVRERGEDGDATGDGEGSDDSGGVHDGSPPIKGSGFGAEARTWAGRVGVGRGRRGFGPRGRAARGRVRAGFSAVQENRPPPVEGLRGATS